jgi:hypothetical protein
MSIEMALRQNALKMPWASVKMEGYSIQPS